MDATRAPAKELTAPAPPPRRRRISPNAALIAGVGTLLLAMGVGVLIGHSGNQTVATNAAAPAQVITVHGGGEAGVAANKQAAGATTSDKGARKDGADAKSTTETGQGAEEVLKPSAGVKLPPATAQPGSKCESGAAGCEGGEFTGDFFGE